MTQEPKVNGALHARDVETRSDLMSKFSPEETALRSRSIDAFHVDECSQEESAVASEQWTMQDIKCQRAMAERRDARLRRAQWVGLTYRWSPMRFVRWVKSVAHSLRITKWRLLMRAAMNAKTLAGPDPRWRP